MANGTFESIAPAPSAGGAQSGDIAVVGMAGRFPGARNIDEFWANLVSGEESIRRLSDEELLKAGVPRRDFESADYVRACPVLDDIDKFDAAFFGLSPRDASVMDPAHRFFLEVAWEALEHSGNSGLPEEGRVGVFAGSGAPLYWMNNVATHREIVESMGEFLVRHTGNDMNFLATRASYDLDLRGPSINVQTACSSALVAAHLARQSLLAGECDMALIGGSTIVVPMGRGYHYKEGEILSPDGHCRPFDHRSAGTVFGSGAACLVIKRLSDALDNGDTIHAVIKGSAVNNDGSMKVGFLAPGVEGQADVIRKALEVAGVGARSIGYVEAHGTGTSVGDPIELTALEQAFSEQTLDKQFCGIGSVKSNIGHLGEAAAAASLIKVVLALKHRTLPPSLGYERPNPRFAMDDSPFFVNASLKVWDRPEPLLAGITALGAGGTNCHLILGEPPPALAGEGGRDCQLFVLSAKAKPALERMSERLASHLEASPDLDIADVAYTLAMGRRELSHRRVFAARNHAEAIGLLRGQSPTRVATTAADTSDPEVVFTFPGGGAQYAGMCSDLYASEPAYRAAFDDCLEGVDSNLGRALRSLLLAAPADFEASTRTLQRPSLSLPALFAVEYALARLFESYGVRPAAYIGHSMGEYVAACLVGVFSIQDGLRLVHLRGRLFETTQKGKMIGVSLSEEVTRSLMPEGLSIAAINAPELCVASGPVELIDKFSETLAEREIDWTPIHIDVAAHSSLLEPILAEFRGFCRSIDFRPPQRPVASNLTGRWLTATEATDPEYWVQHLRNTVRFADCVETVLAGGNRVFVEIGPGRTLTTLVGAQKTKVRHAVNSVRHPKEAANDVDYALLTLGKVWAAGAKVDWTALYDEQLRNRVPLPSYPFEKNAYWVEPKAVRLDDQLEPVKRESVDDWFSTVAWEQAPLVVGAPVTPLKRWLLFVHDPELAHGLTREIEVASGGGCEFVLVSTGPRFRRLDGTHFEVRPGASEQYRELLEMLVGEGRAPEHIVLIQGATQRAAAAGAKSQEAFWGRKAFDKVRPRAGTPTAGSSTPRERLELNFLTPAHLCQAMASVLDAASFTVVTENGFSLSGEALDPWVRLNLGPVLVMPRELPDFKSRLIDIGPRNGSPAVNDARVRQLARELVGADHASPVVLRSPTRWAQHLRPTRMPAVETSTGWLDDGDVVLITGGLGGIGLVLAEHLTRKKKLRLALMSRDGLPPRQTWSGLLSDPQTPAQTRRRIVQVQLLESLGAQVMVVRADVTDESSLSSALTEVRVSWGPLSAVIHAAGVMDDEPLQSKTDDKMHRVLAPKILGVVHLDALITEDLKAFVLMSSVASFLGLPGQIDYTAANAFLDAFAEDRRLRAAGRTLSINWNAWRDVGMVVDVDRRTEALALPAGRSEHPWLDAFEETPKGWRYFTDFSVASHWLLSEHQIEGADALVPGTGFVELARAAYADAAQNRPGAARSVSPIELCQVTFLSPFQVGATQVRRLQIDVEWSADIAFVTLKSTVNGQTHMTAEVLPCQALPRVVNLEAVSARCGRVEPTRDGYLDQDFVRFGPRWQNLEEIRLGQDEALVKLSLREPFENDLGVLAYHPALLDMATGAAQSLIAGFQKGSDFLVPFGYDRIRLFAPVGRSLLSHVRLRAGATAEVAAFDVTIVDESGSELISIEGFTMKRVDHRAEIVGKGGEQHHTRASGPNAVMEALLREAITREEGVVAFDRALAQTEVAQLIASSVDVNVWRRKLEREGRRNDSAESGDAGPNFSRPTLASDYAPPVGTLEAALAAVWSKLLGVSDVGVLDDFFELGGNSLVAVRLFSRVKRDFGMSMPLSTLFQAPTIRLLAAALREQGYIEAASLPNVAASDAGLAVGISPESVMPSAPAVPKTGEGRMQPVALIRPGAGRPPLFFVHDGLGEILLYRSLALRLHAGHPVYGLDPEVSGGRFTNTRIVEMAKAKIERIRVIQPSGPYLLAGLCAGGVIAFEMARQLQEAGEETRFVGIIDAADVAAEARALRVARGRFDRVMETLRPATNESIASSLCRVVPALMKKAMNLVKYETTALLERSRSAKKVAAIRRRQTTLSDTQTTIDFLRLYELAHREHVGQGTFRGGDTVLFRAMQGDGTVGDVPFKEVYADPLLGWQSRVEDAVQVIDVPGGHSSALREPHVDVLAKMMQCAIDAALARGLRGVAPRAQSPLRGQSPAGIQYGAPMASTSDQKFTIASSVGNPIGVVGHPGRSATI